MGLMTLKHYFLALLVAPLSFAVAEVSPAPISPFAKTTASVRFRNKTDIYLRDANLKNPVGINEGAEISIDPAYLKKHFGTETPTAEQLQRFMLNPGEYTHGRVDAETFRSANGKQGYDYFIPVTVRTPYADAQSGKVALQYYSRMGQLDVIPAGEISPQTSQYSRTLIAQNRVPTTQAETCDTCRPATLPNAPGNGQNLTAIRAALETGARTSSNVLFARYQEFARGFTARNGRITKANAGVMKRKFVKELIDTFGQADAATILAALTGFAESPSRSSSVSQVAEIAAILKIIENRARSNYRTNSRVLRDIGITNPDPRLAVILADWQFSAWNDRDNMLSRILNLNPNSGDSESNRRVAMAFETQQLMQSGQVQFMGRLNDSRLLHYHANYVYPAWARQGTRVAAIVRVNGVNVDLSAQRGARHLFYTGVP
jgi:hypothetical protein